MPTVAPAPISIGSRFRTIQSPVVPIPFDAGNTRSVELPRSFPYKQIACRLRGSIATGTSATSNGENPLGLIKRLDLIADGRKLLQSLAGQDAFRLSGIYQGKHGPLLPATAGTGTTLEIEAGFYLHQEAARMLSPIMSYFDPRPYEKVELRCQWGTVSDVYATPGTAVVGAETALDLQIVQSAEGAEQIAFNRLISFDEYSFASGTTVSNFAINVPRSGLLAGILIRTYQAGLPTNAFFQNTAAASTNVFGSVSLKSDNNFLHIDTLNPTTLQFRNVMDYALDGPQPTAPIGTWGLPPSGNYASSTAQPLGGYYFLDLTEDGLMTSLLNTFDLNVLQLIVSSFGSLGAATTMRITYVFYEPITAA